MAYIAYKGLHYLYRPGAIIYAFLGLWIDNIRVAGFACWTKSQCMK